METERLTDWREMGATGLVPGSIEFSAILERGMNRERDTERKACVCAMFRVQRLRTESVRTGWVREEWQGVGFQLSPLIQKIQHNHTDQTIHSHSSHKTDH